MSFQPGTKVWVAVQQKSRVASALVGTPSVEWLQAEVATQPKGAAPAALANGSDAKKNGSGGKAGSAGAGAGGSITVVLRAADGGCQQLTVSPANIHFRGDIDDASTDDLVRLDYLHEPGVLDALRGRYELDLIYTYAQNILIAVNPHKAVPHLYGTTMMQQYHGSMLGDITPHAYAVAEEAFRSMVVDGESQAILISGESGAGKTETAKMVMQYLAHRAMPMQSGGDFSGLRGRHGASEVASSSPLEEEVLQSNPLLEAFGNAKTSRNDNSSRFGKFVQMLFDDDGRVVGAHISTFLLERSRVVSVDSPQRSYHIFYQLCTGASDDLVEQLHLEAGPRGFAYLASSDVFELASIDDAVGFQETLAAMKVVGLSRAQRSAVLQLVAAILHLGNVRFLPADRLDACPSNHEAGPADAHAEAALQHAAELLEVPSEQLRSALLTRTITMRADVITTPLDAAAAAASRDALAKTLYAQLFDWIVAAINERIGVKPERGAERGEGGDAGGRGAAAAGKSIGILDIYGFESFVDNSFEQLCINLANEKLQQQFNAHILRGQQAMYEQEGIDWSYVDFEDNQVCLDLLEGAAKVRGVFPLIDEACKLSRTTAADLADAIRKTLHAAPRFVAPLRHPQAFAVIHYAGVVLYSCKLLLEKNLEYVVGEHAALLTTSSSALVQGLAAQLSLAAQGSGKKSNFRMESVGARFRKQLRTLMAQLYECKPHYIRCIKPNAAGEAGAFAPVYSADQLRAGGVLEAVRIASAGYPTRKPFGSLVHRYQVLLTGHEGDRARGYDLGDDEARHLAVAVMRAAAVDADAWRVGITLVFMRSGVLAKLEGMRSARLSQRVTHVQARWRGFAARQRLKRQHAAARRLQRAVRALFARRALRARSAVTLQAWWRGHVVRRVAREARREAAAVTLQAWWRMAHARRVFLETSLAGARARAAAEEASRAAAAATVIQAHVRRRAAQRRAAALREERVRWARLQADHSAAVTRAESAVAAAGAALDAAERERVVSQSLRAELEATKLVAAGKSATAGEIRELAHKRELASLTASVARLEAENTRALAEISHFCDRTVALSMESATARDDYERRQELSAEQARVQRQTIAQLREHLAGALELNEKLRQDAADSDEINSGVVDGLESQFRDAMSQAQAATAKCQAAQASAVDLTARLASTQAELVETRQRADSQAAELERLQAVVAEHERVRARDAELRSSSSQRRGGANDNAHASGALSRDLTGIIDAAWSGESPHACSSDSARPVSARARGSGSEPHRMTLEGMFDRVVSAQLQSAVHRVAGVAFPAAVYSLVATLQFVSDAEQRNPTPDGMRAAGETVLQLAAERAADAGEAATPIESLRNATAWCVVCVASGATLALGHRADSATAATAAALLRHTGPAGRLAYAVQRALDLDPRRVEDLFKLPPRASAAAAHAAAPNEVPQGWKRLQSSFAAIAATAPSDGSATAAALLPVAAALRYLDITVFNSMLMFRRHCAIRTVKAFKEQMSTFRQWLTEHLIVCLPSVSPDVIETTVDQHFVLCRDAAAFIMRMEDFFRQLRGGQDLGHQLDDVTRGLNSIQMLRLVDSYHDGGIVFSDKHTIGQRSLHAYVRTRCGAESPRHASGHLAPSTISPSRPNALNGIYTPAVHPSNFTRSPQQTYPNNSTRSPQQTYPPSPNVLREASPRRLVYTPAPITPAQYYPISGGGFASNSSNGASARDSGSMDGGRRDSTPSGPPPRTPPPSTAPPSERDTKLPRFQGGSASLQGEAGGSPGSLPASRLRTPSAAQRRASAGTVAARPRGGGDRVGDRVTVSNAGVPSRAESYMAAQLARSPSGRAVDSDPAEGKAGREDQGQQSLVIDAFRHTAEYPFNGSLLESAKLVFQTALQPTPGARDFLTILHLLKPRSLPGHTSLQL